jgi:hypothetical protein
MLSTSESHIEASENTDPLFSGIYNFDVVTICLLAPVHRLSSQVLNIYGNYTHVLASVAVTQLLGRYCLDIMACGVLLSQS